MKNPFLLTILVMFVLYFLWWFSGGTLTGILQQPIPAQQFAAFMWQNFQTGAATIFEAISSFLGI